MKDNIKDKLCLVDNCFEVAQIKGTCLEHRQKHLKNEHLNTPKKLLAKGNICAKNGCNEEVRCKLLCSKHYNKAVRNKEKCVLCGKSKSKGESSMCWDCWFRESQKNIPTEKICTKCNIKKSVDEFGIRRNEQGRTKWRSRCRTCEAVEQRERVKQKKLAGTLGIRNRSSEKRNKAVLAMKKYCESLNLPWEQVIQQYPDNGLCKICNQEPCSGYSRLSLDHDHKTGGFRGFICSKCNHFLGLANDDTEILKNAIKYLESKQILPT